MDDKYSPDSRLFWYLAVIGVVSVLIYLLTPILTPFLLAAVIAYIYNPVVTWLEARKISRTLSTVFVMLMTMGIFIAMALILFPLFEKEISRLIERTPFFLDLVKSRFIPWLGDNFNVELQIDILSHQTDADGTLEECWRRGCANAAFTEKRRPDHPDVSDEYGAGAGAGAGAGGVILPVARLE